MRHTATPLTFTPRGDKLRRVCYWTTTAALMVHVAFQLREDWAKAHPRKLAETLHTGTQAPPGMRDQMKEQQEAAALDQLRRSVAAHRVASRARAAEARKTN